MTQETDKLTLKLNFRTLPLIEVILRLFPARPIPLELKVVTRMASALDGLYSKAEYTPEVHRSIGGSAFPFGVPFQGLRFREPTRGLSLIVQPDLVLLRWQNRTLEASLEYPRWAGMHSLLKDSVEALRRSCPDFPRFHSANLSYCDFVSTSAQPRPEDVEKYVRTGTLSTVFGGATRLHESNLSWKHEDGVDLRLHVQAASGALKAPTAHGFTLTSIAGNRFEPADWPGEDLERLHQHLLKLFLDLVTNQAKLDWGFYDD